MYKIFIVFLLSLTCVYGQQSINDKSDRYFEDQFYTGISYNFLLNKPDNVSLRNFSYGFQAGFIKDIPFSKEGNYALGIGLGYAVNSYYTNIKSILNNGAIEYSVVDEDVESLKRSKIETHLFEIPIELRWRTSSLTEYKFWRIYSGVKFGYVFNSESKFISDASEFSFSNTDISKFHYGLTISVGYNTFNFQAYYALNDFFSKDVNLVDGGSLELVPLRVGIIFYIL